MACHECGHAFGCWLCGEKVTEFVPFTLNDPERLGYVRHTLSGGWKGAIANLVIGTGPIWFGCSILALLAWLFGNAASVANWSDYFAADALPGVWTYAAGVWSAAVDLVRAVFGGASGGASGDAASITHPFWHAVGVVVWFYLSFAIASEIGLSDTDLGSCFAGAVLIVAALFAVNLVPSAGRLVSVAGYIALPTLFTVHALMLFAALVNAALLMVMKVMA